MQGDVPVVLLFDTFGKFGNEICGEYRHRDRLTAMDLLASPLLVQACEVLVGKDGHLLGMFVCTMESGGSGGADIDPESELTTRVVAPQGGFIGVVESASKLQVFISGQGAGQDPNNHAVGIFRRMLGDAKLQRLIDAVVDIGEFQMESTHCGRDGDAQV